MSDTVAYRVKLGSGRSADRVLKTLCYGRKPKWLSGGWVTESRYSFLFVLPSQGCTLTAMLDYGDELDVLSKERPDAALYVAENLAGKRGTVTPLTQADLDREFAEEYERANQ